MMRERSVQTSAGALHGAIFEPEAPSAGSVFFTHGWSGRWQDYGELLDPIAKSGYRCVAFNLRGHGGNPGHLDIDACASDLVSQYASFRGERNFFLNHSLAEISLLAAQKLTGSGNTPPDGMILMQPYVHPDLLRPLQRLGIYASPVLQHVIDPDLARTEPRRRCAERKGLHMDRLWRNTATLAHVDLASYHIDIPLLYFLADQDRLLGTGSAKRRERYHRVIQDLSDHVEDGSGLVQKLNHCWNYPGRPEEYSPFLKEERGKEEQREAVLARILEFIGTAGRSPQPL